MAAHYVEPVSGATYPIDAPRWRSDDGRPLMIGDLPGIGRADIVADAALALALRRRAAVRDRRSRDDGRGPDAAGRAALGRRARLVQARMVLADGKLQGSRRVGDDFGAARSRASTRCSRTVPATAARRSRPMRRRRACARRSSCPPIPSRRKTVQMRAYGAEIELVPGARAGHVRRGDPAVAVDLLRQPQLAAVLPAGHEDARL